MSITPATSEAASYKRMTFTQLKQFWNVDKPWESQSLLEPLNIKLGQQLYQQSMNLQRRRLGLVKCVTNIEGFNLTWFEQRKPLRGKPTLLLIHGLSGDKDNWLLFASPLVKKYNLVIVDLPAHGETRYLPDQSYTAQAQARRLFKLLDHLHLTQVHVVGHSMGGFVATMMALNGAQRISSLTLISSAGVVSPKESALEQGMEVGKNAFIVNSLDSHQAFMKMAAYKPIWMPKPVALALAKKSYEHRERVVRCLSDILPEIFIAQTVTKRLQELTLPILVIWGKQDHLIDVSIMHYMATKLPHAKTISLDNTGHLALVEKPKVTAQHFLKFLKTVKA